MIQAIISYAKKNKGVTWLRTSFPMLFLYLVIKPLNLFRFKKEKRLLKNKITEWPNKPSVILYTTHKCASTYTTTLLAEICAKNEFHTIDLEAFLALHDKDILSFPEKNQSLMPMLDRPEGFYFGPMRYFFPFTNQSSSKKILVLRDPRDVLTSYYYSKLHSHIVINKQFANERAYFKDYSIDEFVLEMLPDIKKRYSDYIEKLLSQPSVLINSYEKMIGDFDTWLRDLIDFVDLPVSDEWIKSVKDKRITKPSGDKNQHIRSIQPGDHKRKLNQETITLLNIELKDILQTLGYAEA